MKFEEITSILTKLFVTGVQNPAPGSWQIETSEMRMLVIVSDDRSWLRILIPIVASEAAQPFFEQLLEANFDDTQETRYALHQGVIWGVFQHGLESLTVDDFSEAISRLLSMHQRGLSDSFNQFAENRIVQIIQVAKRQGQSLEATLQTLDRFYEEGLMGDMSQGAQSREAMLDAWRSQLQRLWEQVGE